MKNQKKSEQRYFALAFKNCGYVLDYYPEERAAYLREEKKHIIGDFATKEEAHNAILNELRRRKELQK